MMYKVVQVTSLIVIVFLGLIVYSKAAKSVFFAPRGCVRFRIRCVCSSGIWIYAFLLPFAG